LLTSGQQASALEGAPLIRALVERSRERIVVMPGAGVTADNIVELAKMTGACELHSSAKKRRLSATQHRQSLLEDMQEGEMLSDEGRIKKMAQAMHSYLGDDT
jgi:copper homeostasis protein